MQIVTSAVHLCVCFVSCELREVPVAQSLGRLIWLQEKVKHPSDTKNEKRACFLLLLLLQLGLTPTLSWIVDVRLLTGDASMDDKC